jgi:hypothetical protein
MRLLSLLIVAASLASAQNVLFSDDAERAVMENYVTGGWTINAGLASSTAQIHSGKYSYAATTSGSDASAYIAYAPGSYDPVFLKLWVYLPTAYTLGSGSSARIAGLAQVPGSFATYALNITNSGGSILLQAGGTNGTHALSRDAWHSVEMRYAVSAGQVTLWMDGTSDIALTGLTLESKNNVLIGIGSGSGTVYLDDITLTDTVSTNPTSSLTVRHAYLTNRIKAKIQTYLWGADPTDSLVASIDGTPFSTTANPGKYQEPVLDMSGLSAGSHALLVELKTSGGTVRSTYSETITALGAVPAVGIDENNNLVSGGHKVFPITAWISSGANNVSWFNSGYVNMAGWTSEFSASYNPTQYQGYMESSLSCLTSGIKAMGPSNGRIDAGGCNTPGGSAACSTAFASYTSTLKDHACVFAWTGFDEASVNGWTTAQMQAAQTAVHANDNKHPIIYDDASFPYLNLSWYSPYLVADVYSSDNYPLCYSENFASNGGKTFKDWVSMMDRDDRANYGLVPNLIVLELYKFVNAGAHFDCTKVTAASVYNEAWLSVIHGRKGVTWYDNGAATSGYAPACANDAATECFPANPNTHIGKFTAQIAAITPDMVLAPPTSRTIASNRTSAGSRVDVALRESGSTAWVFAARLTDVIANSSEDVASPLSTTITVSGMTGTTTATVLNESRTVSMVDGVITDNFSPYGVHLYSFSTATGSAIGGKAKHGGKVSK